PAEGAAVVGGAPPPAPQALRHRARPALAARPQLVVVACRLGPGRRPRRHELAGGARLGPLPGAALAGPQPLGAGPGRRGAVPARRGLERAGLGLLHGDGAAVPRDVPGQLAVPRPRRTPVRHPRRQPQQPAGGPADAGRGLAQQPPPLPKLGPAGLLLVGDGRQLLRPPGAGLGWAGLGHPRAAPGARDRIHARPVGHELTGEARNRVLTRQAPPSRTGSPRRERAPEPMSTLFSAFDWSFLGVTSALLFPGALLLWSLTAPFDPARSLLHRYTCWWALLYLRCLPGCRVRVEGRGKIAPHTPYVLVANHQSSADIMALSALA